MTPAAPLEKAVEDSRKALALLNDDDLQYSTSIAVVNINALRSLLAAIDADKRLEEAEARLERIDAWAGERCEASGCRPDPCGPVEYHDVEGVPLCAECWQECCEDAAVRGEGNETT